MFLKDFRNFFKSTLEGDPDIKNKAADTLTALSSSKLPDAASQISSFGIGFALSLLGQYLYTKKSGSPTARIIAKILNAPVDGMNRDFVLQKMQDKEYRNAIHENILKVVETSSIDEFSKALDLTPGEAWEVYRQIKDMVIDSEIIGMISRLHSETGRIEDSISAEARDLRTAIDKQLDEVSKLQASLDQTYGLSWLPRNYFEDHISTTEDTEKWEDGFEFKLPSIMQKIEFRRNALIDEIKSRLEEKCRLLLVGESGTSKTTILMEILTDYFVEGYEILYNLRGAEIKNGQQLVSFIEERAKCGAKILVVVDNVYSEKTSAIFYAMDEISSFRFTQNVRFLLAARIPEYDSFVNDRLNQVREEESIIKFNNDPKFRFDLPLFTHDEIKGFTKKYIGKPRTAEDEELLNDVSRTIFEETRGHPIMVKFYLLGGGLHPDVERRYKNYLSGDSRKMQIMLVCSLLDIGSLPITDELLQDIGLLREAYNLENATLHRFEGFWKTIHPRWDEELFSYLYNESDGGRLLNNKEYLKTALDSIFNIKEDNTAATQERAYSVIETIYDIAARHVMPATIIDSVISIPSYLTDEQKAELYTYYIAQAYSALKKFQNAIYKLNEALTLRPNFIPALVNKGIALDNLGKYNEAIECYDKAIKINPNDSVAWNNKGIALQSLGQQDADRCFAQARDLDLKP